MTGDPGRFAGKDVVGSAPGRGAVVHLTVRTLPHSGNEPKRYIPAMQAKAAGENQHVTLYDRGDGSVRVRLDGGAVDHPGGAVAAGLPHTHHGPGRRGGRLIEQGPDGQRWKIRTAQELRRVSYTLDPVAPIMTTKGTAEAPDLLVPTTITPPLADIVSSRNGPSGVSTVP